MNTTKKTIESDYYEPEFVEFRARGKYPFDLLLGYENEVELANGPSADLVEKTEKIINKYPFLYAKYDGSLNFGCEFNTHPFNWNWFQKNDVLQYVNELQREGFIAKRSCGFHVHLSKKYFSRTHLTKMIKFFYGYPEFIDTVSQRRIMDYCKTDIKRNVQNYLYDLYNDTSDVDLTTLHGCRRAIMALQDEFSEDKYMALNLQPDNTIEIRIFQGTVNKKLILAYLEFCVASVFFTQKTPFRRINPDTFKAYVKRNSKYYQNLLASGLLCKRTKKGFSWIMFDAKTRAA